MKRALGVIRLSRYAGEDDPSTSPARQRDHITRAATVRGLELTDWAEDLDVSASLAPFDRPELGERLGHPERYDALIVWRLDRISRSVGDTHELIEWAKAHDVNIISATEPFDLSTEYGKVFVYLTSVFAQMEKNFITERIRDTQTAMRQSGRWGGGHYAWWLTPTPTPDGNGKILIPHPDRAPLMLEVVDRATKGESMPSICEDLDRRGVKTPWRAKRWSATTLRELLRSRALLGEATHKGEPVTDENGLPIRRSASLITRQRFNELQAALDRAGRPKTRPRSKGVYLLTGVIYCAICGGKRYYRSNKGSSGKMHQYIGCSNRWVRRTSLDRCPAPTIRSEVLERFAEKIFLQNVGDVEVTETRYIPAEDHTEELEDLKEAWHRLQREMEGKPESVRALYAERVAVHERRIAELSALPVRPASVERVPTEETYAGVWSRGTTEERRKLLLDGGFKIAVAPVADDAESLDAAREMMREVLGELLAVGWHHDNWGVGLYCPPDVVERMAT